MQSASSLVTFVLSIFFKIAPINFHQRLRVCNHVKIVSNTKRSNAKRVFPYEICHFLQLTIANTSSQVMQNDFSLHSGEMFF